MLSGVASYTGATMISNVTVTLDNAGSTTARLAGTSGVTLNPGGVLRLASTVGASTDRVSDNVPVTLAGGTFDTAGLSEDTVGASLAPVQCVGALTLTTTSVLELGAGASTVTFADSSSDAWTADAQLRVYGLVRQGGRWCCLRVTHQRSHGACAPSTSLHTSS